MHPQRPKLADTVVAELKSAFALNRWGEWLPEERQLARELKVSRSTLRDALVQLRAKGLVETEPNNGSRIVSTKAKTSVPASAAPHVNLLMGTNLNEVRPTAAWWIDELRAQLAERGGILRVVESRAAFSGSPGKALARLIQHRPAACWALRLSTRQIQEWFSTHKHPCVVVGTSFPHVNLPFVDRDHLTTCRHAVGRLVAAGHRRICLCVPAAQKAGDVESERGFREGATMSGLETGEFRVARMPDNPPGIHRMMERLLTARFAATALLVTQPEAYLTVFSSLAARRLRVPEDISLIDCAHDAFLDHLLPQPTGYHIAPSVFASHVLRLVMDVIEGRPLEVPRRLILPEFVRGGSVGRVE